MVEIEVTHKETFSDEEVRVYRDGFKVQLAGWYFNYAGVSAFHGPYPSKDEAMEAGKDYAAKAVQTTGSSYDREAGTSCAEWQK